MVRLRAAMTVGARSFIEGYGLRMIRNVDIDCQLLSK
jgi:hypothetical protein